MWTIPNLYKKLGDMLFPPACYLCKQQGSTLCDSCFKSLPCATDSPAPYIFSFLSYRDTNVKKLIHAGKYYHQRHLLQELVHRTISTHPHVLEHADTAICIPVPMHPMRKLIRGYNQAEIIADILAAHYHIPYLPKILRRTKLTARQVRKTTKQERERNQRGSFSIVGDVYNKHIILVDDITTTGATLHELRKILLDQGVASVQAITIAH
jgi:ComF family protein